MMTLVRSVVKADETWEDRKSLKYREEFGAETAETDSSIDTAARQAGVDK
jgi:hypothetical protein